MGGGVHNRVKHIYICLNGENLWKSHQDTTELKKFKYLQGDLMAIKKSNFACVYMQNISQYDSGERCGPWASCFITHNLCIVTSADLRSNYAVYLKVVDFGSDSLQCHYFKISQMFIYEVILILGTHNRRLGIANSIYAGISLIISLSVRDTFNLLI